MYMLNVHMYTSMYICMCSCWMSPINTLQRPVTFENNIHLSNDYQLAKHVAYPHPFAPSLRSYGGGLPTIEEIYFNTDSVESSTATLNADKSCAAALYVALIVI